MSCASHEREWNHAAKNQSSYINKKNDGKRKGGAAPAAPLPKSFLFFRERERDGHARTAGRVRHSCERVRHLMISLLLIHQYTVPHERKNLSLDRRGGGRSSSREEVTMFLLLESVAVRALLRESGLTTVGPNIH